MNGGLTSQLRGFWMDWGITRSLQMYRAARMGAVLLVGIILANSHWTTGQIGTFEWLLFIGTTLTVFWVNGFLQSLIPRYAEMDPTNGAGLLYTLFWVFTGLSVVIVLLAWVGRDFLIPLLTGRNSLQFFSIYLFFLLWHVPGFMLEYVYLLREESRRMVWVAGCSYSTYVLAVVAALLVGWGIGGCMALLGVWAFLRWLWTFYEVGKWKGTGFMYREVPVFLQLSLPMVGYFLLNGMSHVVDGVLVGWFYEDNASFAVFRYGAREIPLYAILIGSFTASIIPAVVNRPQWALQEMRRKGRQYMHLFFGMNVVFMLIADPLFPILYNEDFSQSASIFKCYLLLVLARVIFPNSWLMGKKRTKVLFRASAIELMVNAALSIWWVRWFGMEGIAMATVVANLVEHWGLIWWVKTRHGVSVRQYADIKTYSIWSFLLILVFILSYWIY